MCMLHTIICMLLVPESRRHSVYMSELICMVCIQGRNMFPVLNLFSNGRNLSNMASLETLDLTVWENTALSALSAIFSSSTIKNLLLRMDCPVTVREG